MKAESGALFQQKERGGEGGRTEDMGPPEKVVQSKERKLLRTYNKES